MTPAMTQGHGGGEELFRLKQGRAQQTDSGASTSAKADPIIVLDAAASHVTALELVFLLCLFKLAFAAERNLVDSLPGYEGVLPFSLETGYVNVYEENGAELFYYFIQSEDDPRRDPVLLWLTGGDHCTVFSGLALEIGPVKFIREPYNGSVPRLKYNPYSWTKAANIIFVDSPVGAGFSFSRHPKGYDVGDVSSSLQLKKFLYKGFLVGNPATGESIDTDSRVPYAHGVGIISDQLYELLNECSKPHILYKKCFYVSPGPNDESPARMILKKKTKGLKRPPPRPSMDCQNYVTYLSYFWANSMATRDALGIEKGSKDEWVRCHDHDLPYSKDIKSSIKYHRNLTLKGYRALVYSGDHDAVIPFLGTQAWVRSLNFSIVDDWRAWHVDGQSAGFAIAYSNNLTFATVKGGGHTAPEFQPERCLAMFKRWISNKPL
ncbi:serine carboxypeptidase-like 11 [Panicum miliaceum]|uniref:Serine carboxypeptidase-like 11 n=1 Tax=Panicum miliaceum TaxID=4540 RepID=A0A3L6PZ61_PANMI|nr:serine carboxypeptidase-like 11 [Panicum miliaceum]